MGSKYCTAAGSVQPGGGDTKLRITSLAVTPAANGAICAHCTVYNATAATANTEVLYFHCGTANPRTVSWSDPNGIEVSSIWVVPNCAFATIVWD